DDWQVENAKFIIAVVKGHELGEEVAVVALITAIVEAWLYNYEPAVDADSGGLFQQRQSMGWGTYDEVGHKKLAADAFLLLGGRISCLLVLSAPVTPGRFASLLSCPPHRCPWCSTPSRPVPPSPRVPSLYATSPPSPRAPTPGSPPSTSPPSGRRGGGRIS